jgi:TolA-binding protein
MRRFRLSVIAAFLTGMALMPIPSQAEDLRRHRAQESASSAAEVQRLQKEIHELEERISVLEALDQKVKALDQRLDRDQDQSQQQRFLARRLEVQQDEVQQRVSGLPTITANARGLTVSSPDKQFTASVHGLIQGDGQFYTKGDDKTVPGGVTSSTFVLNRVRPILSGTVFKDYD